MQDDELILLWRQGTSAEPDPERIARLAGRASIRRFDRAIFWRNFSEYVAGVVMFPFLVWMIVTDVVGIGRVYGVTALVGIVFVLGYLWWQNRALTPLDPSSDARAYQAAMLTRIDRQILLLGRIRYWYLMPLYAPGLWVVGAVWKKSPVGAVVVLVIYTGVFVFIGWLNESWGVRKLRGEREKIEALYQE
jgi:hypothetical protein